jgi:phosphohistidine phosphatase
METERHLILLRHAKSAYPHGVPDHDRPLAGKGRRNAQAAGRWFVAEGPRVSLALCSDATRARHTWEIVRSELSRAKLDVPTRSEPRLYWAAPPELLAMVRALPAELTNVLIVGHEPTMSASTLLLAGEGSDPTALSRLSDKFPTNAVAVLRLTGPWAELSAGCAALETFAKPRS